MKINNPVTDKQRIMVEGTILATKTDLKGVITYVNQDFINISGYSEQELLGSSHNIVRHPDMPVGAFQSLWDTVKQGLPWEGIVKNRCKNGDYYWVHANVIPITENSDIVGYMSVRTIPSQQQIDKADALYRAIKAGHASLGPSWLQKTKMMIVNTKASHTIYAAIIGSLIIQLLLTVWMAGGMSSQELLTSAAAILVVTALTGSVLKGLVVSPLYLAVEKLQKMTEGDYFDWISTGRTDEIGQLYNTIKTTQVRLGLDVIDKQQVVTKALRVQSALDQANTNVMIANAEMEIVYINDALSSMFRDAQDDIRLELPNFNVDNLVGSNIDSFHQNPQHQRNIVEKLQKTVKASFKLGGRSLEFLANPIVSKEGGRVGTVVEWTDRTQQVLVEDEIDNIVSSARNGDLSQRLDLSNKESFLKSLAEQLNGLLEVNEGVVTDTVRVFSALARGDLTETIDGPYQGDFGQIQANANETVIKLTAIINEIRNSAESVKQGAAEIANGNLSLSDRTEKQASSLERTASSMEEITSTVKQSAYNASQANELVLLASERANNGGTIVEAAVKAMNELSDSSHKIAEIIGVIDDIAFQTNLLALNASVEAARAGEQGRGFAVVASEVRNLAGRSASAAKEIKELIDDSSNKVNLSVKLVNQSGDSLKEIVDGITQAVAMVSDIASASKEQSQGISEVNLAINQMDTLTQQNVALVEEAAAASEILGKEAAGFTNLVSMFTIHHRSPDLTIVPESRSIRSING